MATLEIRDLHVTVDTEDGPKEILKGVDLTIREGETHAIMGPNGSGKSTLAYSIAGHPKYTVTGGSVTLDGEDVLAMKVDERARAGLFLAMQYPVEVPGVSVSNFLRTAKTAIDGEAPKLRTWVKDVNSAMEAMKMDPAFATRSVNEGFSGGEKKRHEILQLELLEPKVAVLDETDSGLDIDALKVVSEGVNRFQGQGRPRCPADHALHADPALHHAGLRARLRRRQDRRGGRPGARRGARGQRLRQVRQGQRLICFDPTTTEGTGMTVTTALPGLLDGLDLVRADFPILQRTMADGHPLVYLDSANTSQKPQVVIDAMVDHLERHNANVARAMHQLGAESTAGFEGARDKVAAFLNAPSRDEVIFTKNASEAINLVANTLAWAEGPLAIGEGDEVLITEMEHHSNIVPWQLLTERTGATLRWFGIDRRRPPRPVEHRRADHRAHQGRRADLGLQHARHRQPGRGDRRAARTRSAPRRASTPAQAVPQMPVDVQAARASTSWPSPATRSSARPGSACCGAGASCSSSCRRSSVAAR